MTKVTITNSESERDSEVKIKTLSANGDPGGHADVVLLGGESITLIVNPDSRLLVTEQRVPVRPVIEPNPPLVDASRAIPSTSFDKE